MNGTEVGFFFQKNKNVCFLINVKHLSGIKTENDDKLEMTAGSSFFFFMILIYEHLYCIEKPLGAIS
jgi:hypothetical protein